MRPELRDSLLLNAVSLQAQRETTPDVLVWGTVIYWEPDYDPEYEACNRRGKDWPAGVANLTAISR